MSLYAFTILIATAALVVGLPAYLVIRWKFDWLRERVCPRELLLIESSEERARAHRCGGKAFLRQRTTWIAMIGYSVALCALAFALSAFTSQSGGLGVGGKIILRIGVPLLLIPLMIARFRKWMQLFLREYLNDHGIPICQNCGYDLRGLVSGGCPECAWAFEGKKAPNEKCQ